MPLELTQTLIRSWKGAAISILVCFWSTRRAMMALELSEWTGYKGDAIQEALRLLVNTGWLSARSPRGPWCLCEGMQLPLMEADSVLNGVSEATTTTTMEGKKRDRVAAVVLRAATPFKTESQVYETPGVTFEKNLKACQLCGIGEPKATKISNLPWVSPEFIEAHVKSLYADQVIGLAIVRIQSNELPRTWLDEAKPEQKKSGNSFICDVCGNHPCNCEEHEDDCDCIQCRLDYPERFCKAVVKGRRNERHECNALVVPGEKYCEVHLQEESEDE